MSRFAHVDHEFNDQIKAIVRTDQEIEQRVIAIIEKTPSEGQGLHKIMSVLELASDLVVTAPRVVSVICKMVVKGTLVMVCTETKTSEMQFGVAVAHARFQKRISEDMVE